jgi:ribonuclease HI
MNLIPTLLQINNKDFEKDGEKKDKNETFLDYTFQSDSEEITFRLPKEPVDKMVIATLREISQTKPNDMDKYDISATFYKDIKKDKDDEKGKGKITFLNYADIPDKSKMVLFDEQMGIYFVFDCKIEHFPTPGKNDGVFVYVDGSSQKTGEVGERQEEMYGAGVVISHDKAVYFDLKTGQSIGANYDGEIVAATNAFKYLEEIASDTDNITMFFDNIAIGYTAAGIFNNDKKEKKAKAKTKVKAK